MLYIAIHTKKRKADCLGGCSGIMSIEKGWAGRGFGYRGGGAQTMG
jgi:hypothetical protein